MQRPYTPGPLGYLLAIAVTAVAYPPILLAQTLVEGPLTWVVASVVFGVVAVVIGVPVGLLAAPLIHLLTWFIPFQAVHVVVSAAVGSVTGVGVWLVIDPDYEWVTGQLGWYAGALGLAAALGRTAVIPLVRRRQAWARMHGWPPAAGTFHVS